MGAKLASNAAAKALGVAPQTLSAWERPGRGQSPTVHNLVRAAQLYGVHIAWLAYGVESGPGMADPDRAGLLDTFPPDETLRFWRVTMQASDALRSALYQYRLREGSGSARVEILEDVLARWELIEDVAMQLRNGTVANLIFESDDTVAVPPNSEVVAEGFGFTKEDFAKGAVRMVYTDTYEPADLESRLAALVRIAKLNIDIFTAELRIDSLPLLDLSRPDSWPETLGIPELAAFVKRTGGHEFGRAVKDASGRTVAFIPHRYFAR